VIYQHLLAGEQSGGSDVDVINPATGLPFARASAATKTDVDRAVDAAKTAFARWARSPLDERRSLLIALADVAHAHAAPLAELLTMETGKPLAEARAEIDAGEQLLRFYAGLRAGETELFRDDRSTHMMTYTPLGVVAGIVPWNFPFYIMAMKLAPALLAGNAIVLKPSETSLASSLEFGRLIAGIVPLGVVQILGDVGTAGAQLASHPGVSMVSLTGSTITGRKVSESAAPTLKRLDLELGGNDPAIVLRDADISGIAPALLNGAFRNAGQVCGAIKRLYVHHDVYEALVAELKGILIGTVVGDGIDPRVTVGPVQNRAQFEKLTAVAAAAERDGTILARAAVPAGDGFFVSPTLFGDLADDHPLVVDEQFGPLLPVLRFSDVDDVITRANATQYGLTASVWTADVDYGESLVSRLEVGLRCVNKHNAGAFDVAIPMAKQSGYGWVFGEESVRGYLQPHLLFR
jgi:acyl-CoA reductase-like NAD-dependent aldehyde dehydrogenase